jgi:hypothetical protein
MTSLKLIYVLISCPLWALLSLSRCRKFSMDTAYCSHWLVLGGYHRYEHCVLFTVTCFRGLPSVWTLRTVLFTVIGSRGLPSVWTLRTVHSDWLSGAAIGSPRLSKVGASGDSSFLNAAPVHGGRHILKSISNSMELSPSLQAASSSSAEVFPNMLWNPQIRYSVYDNPPLVLIVNQLNPGCTTLTSVSKINFNILHPLPQSGAGLVQSV